MGEKSTCKKILHISSETVLVVGGVPAVLLAFLGLATGFILMVSNREYSSCVSDENKEASSDVSDHVKFSLEVQTICALCYAMLFFSGPILFNVIPWM